MNNFFPVKSIAPYTSIIILVPSGALPDISTTFLVVEEELSSGVITWYLVVSTFVALGFVLFIEAANPAVDIEKSLS